MAEEEKRQGTFNSLLTCPEKDMIMTDAVFLMRTMCKKKQEETTIRTPRGR